jgi:hypothetical protein
MSSMGASPEDPGPAHDRVVVTGSAAMAAGSIAGAPGNAGEYPPCPLWIARATVSPMHALGMGPVAARVLLRAGEGRVEAAFERSAYLRFGDEWICLGEPSLEPGPLNVLIAGPAHRWRAGLRPRAGAFVRNGRIHAGGLVIDSGGAPTWRPQPAPPPSEQALGEGLQALEERLPGRLPPEGLADFLRLGARPPGRIARAAAPAIRALRQWLSTAGDHQPCPPEPVTTLVGLGPGLTPSGDDFLCGALAALRALERRERAQALWAAVACQPTGATSPLSLAHLRAAAEVGLAAPLDDLLNALITGHCDRVRAGLTRLTRVDHHSPWDALAGCITVLAVESDRRDGGPFGGGARWPGVPATEPRSGSDREGCESAAGCDDRFAGNL